MNGATVGVDDRPAVVTVTVTAAVCHSPSSYIVRVRWFCRSTLLSLEENCSAPALTPTVMLLAASAGSEALSSVIACVLLVVLKVTRMLSELRVLSAPVRAERSVYVVPSYVRSRWWSTTGVAV
ncbi:hypothetical protein [Streptomyces anulatus]|uniref:hypothetical protein n=1 Tax=Streptomyces anulatus TaxID=1892 RepID=UPI00364F5A36